MPGPFDDRTEETTMTDKNALPQAERVGPVPGLVLVYSPSDLIVDDRARLDQEIVVGRSSECSWVVRDKFLSRMHFAMATEAESFRIRDLESHNGVSVDGEMLEKTRRISAGSVIRAGRCVFVLVPDLTNLSVPGIENSTPIIGDFYADSLCRELRIAARTGRHVLIEGETGTGKELAAGFLHKTLTDFGRKGPFIPRNCASFANEDDAIGALFGVSEGAFTGVSRRKGAIELAQGGTLFLDEIHALPLRAQRSLLRFVEDGLVFALGDSSKAGHPFDVRIIWGTNVSVDSLLSQKELAHDLIARMHRIVLHPLRERKADIPSIFLHILYESNDEKVAEQLVTALDTDDFERLCLADFSKGNVRELIDIATLAGARLSEGDSPRFALDVALKSVLGEFSRLQRPPQEDENSEASSPYEHHKEEIIALYYEVGGNVSKLVELLKKRDIPCSRRWLSEYLERWGLKVIRRRSVRRNN